MADISTDRFLQAYGNFLVAAWGGPPLKNRFKKDPEKVLKEFGLDPEGAKVSIEPPGPKSAQATPESAAKLWNEGKKAGRIRFIFPRSRRRISRRRPCLTSSSKRSREECQSTSAPAAAAPPAAAARSPGAPFIHG